jgi:hypothetical protein
LNDLASILTDTGTTLDNHLTDIKGTGFVKDTHSLIDIETYVDILDDGTSGNAKIATDVAAVLVDTADIQPKLGTPAGANMSADIADIPTVAEFNARTIAAADYFDPAADTVATVTDVTTKTGYSLAATGLDAIVATATGMVEIAKAIWDRVLSGATHNIANSAGKRLRQVDAAFTVHAGTAQAGAANTITLDTGASATDNIYRGDRVVIVGGTGVGEHDIITAYDGTSKVATVAEAWVVTPDATSEFELVPASVDIETWQHNVVTGAGDLNQVETDTAATLVDTGTTIPATLGTPAGADMSADIAAVKADTAAILVDTGTTLDGKIDTIDTNVDAILVDTGTTIPGTITTLQSDTDDIQARLPAALVGGLMSSDVTAISTSTAAADKLEASAETMQIGAAEAGTLSTTVMTTDLTEATNDHYNGRLLIWTSGVLIRQATDITDYLGATGQLTYTAVTEAPSAGDTFIIV